MTLPLPLLCVRLRHRTASLALSLLALAAPAWATLTANADGTVTDTTTSLVWDQCPYGRSGASCANGTALLVAWADALNAAVAANAASYKGFTDWRVPNKNELESLAKLDAAPAIDTTAFPGAPAAGFWTSTTFAPEPNKGWSVTFAVGNTESINKTNVNYVRLVRSGQSSAAFSLLASQAITGFSPTSPVVIGVAPATLSATGGASGNAIVYATTSAASVCTVSASTVTFTGVGTCNLTANQAGNASYDAAPQATASVVITAASQTINFANPGTQTFGTTPTLTATASSGLAPSFTSSTTGVCTITSGGALSFVMAGTCTVAADQAGNANFSAAPQLSQSFAVGQASQTIAFGAAPSVIVGGSGTVSTTGGASGIARVYASTTPAACTVNASTGVVTGVAAGSNNCTITANQAGNTNYSAAAQASQSFGIGAAPEPVPTIAQLPVSIGGLSTLPAILNMADGDGPAFMAALVSMLSNAVGQPLQFVAQNAGGTVTLSGFNGGDLAFIPHGFQTGNNRADGIYPVGNGQYHVVVNGRQVSLAPALVNLDQLTALLPGVAVSHADNGVITATLNGLTHVVQAGVGVQRDAASGTAQLVVGADGLLHFSDALGNNQVLYPAFSEPGALRNILRSLDTAASLNIQLDGTAAIVLNGQRYTLVPDMTLLAVPADRAGQDWWQESATRYRVTNVETFPWRVWSQGFTVRP